MSVQKRIQNVYENAAEVPFDAHSKIVIMSDCHRGTGSGADNFSRNQHLFYAAITHYLRENHLYIELGDGDELWENKDFNEISQEYEHIFQLLSRLYNQGKMKIIFGNHDKIKKRPKWCRCNLADYCGDYEGAVTQLFPDVQVHEGLVLRHCKTGGKLLLLHGHQADFFNDTMWLLSRFLVRYLWRPLELLGVKDPSSSSRNAKRRLGVERHLIHWIQKSDAILVAGHTHRPAFPSPTESRYFNDGSCVHNRYITAIEIENDAICMVKWSVLPKENGVLFVKRDILEGPVPIEAYFAHQKS